MVSSDFGKLDVQRHLSSGIDCAIAGLATAAAAMPTPAASRNSRRFIGYLPLAAASAPTRTESGSPHHTEGLGEIQPRASATKGTVRTPAARAHRSRTKRGAGQPLPDPTSGAGAHPDH